VAIVHVFIRPVKIFFVNAMEGLSRGEETVMSFARSVKECDELSHEPDKEWLYSSDTFIEN